MVVQQCVVVWIEGQSMKWWHKARDWLAGKSGTETMTDLQEEGGIVYAPGYFRSGLPNATKQPLAEMYALDSVDDAPEAWTLAEQERLSYIPGMQHPYLSVWAEALRQGSFSGELPVSAAWVLAIYAGSGQLVHVIRFLPVMRFADVEQVIFQDMTSSYI